jgi:hypothetical protein
VVAWIRRLLAAGLSTATIAEFRACVPDDGSRPAASCRNLVDRLRVERDRIDAAMADLAASRAALDEVIAAGSAAENGGQPAVSPRAEPIAGEMVR